MRTVALPLTLLLGVIGAALAGFSPDPYLEHVRGMPPPHPYPTTTVLWVTLFMATQASVLFAILRPRSYRRSWGRALVAFLVSLSFLALGIVGAMHAPPPWSIYLLWLLAIGAGTLFLLFWSAVGATKSKAGT